MVPRNHANFGLGTLELNAAFRLFIFEKNAYGSVMRNFTQHRCKVPRRGSRRERTWNIFLRQRSSPARSLAWAAHMPKADADPVGTATHTGCVGRTEGRWLSRQLRSSWHLVRLWWLPVASARSVLLGPMAAAVRSDCARDCPHKTTPPAGGVLVWAGAKSRDAGLRLNNLARESRP